MKPPPLSQKKYCNFKGKTKNKAFYAAFCGKRYGNPQRQRTVKIWLNSAEKKAFLNAVVTGFFDTESAPDLVNKLQEENTFLGVLKKLPDNPE